MKRIGPGVVNVVLFPLVVVERIAYAIWNIPATLRGDKYMVGAWDKPTTARCMDCNGRGFVPKETNG